MRRVIVYENHLKEKVVCEGDFHRWGVNSIQTESGDAARFTVAIVEKDNGEVILAYPQEIEFKKINYQEVY